MPNKPNRDKRRSGSGAVGQRSTRRKRTTATAADSTAGPQSAAAILTRSDGLLPQLTQQLALQHQWRAWLASRLPAPLGEQLSGVVEQEGCLTLLAQSAAWGARLRYAVKEIEAEIRAHAPQLQVIRVRVSRPVKP